MKKSISIISSLLILFTVFSFSGKANAEMEYDFLSENELFQMEEEVQPHRGDGQDAFELGFIISHGLLNAPLYSWHKGGYAFPAESLVIHFDKHGKEVKAKNAANYLDKAIAFRSTAKQGVTGKPVYGETPGVLRYSKKGLYIDLAPTDQIISFGTTK